jgi:hypothetical protein
MSQTLVRSSSAGAIASATTYANAWSEAASATAGAAENGYRRSEAARKSAACSDLLSRLRDHFLFDDFASIEAWMNAHREQYGALFVASEQIDLIFGAGRSKWLTVIEDWEGTRVLGLEVEFGGSGEDASRLCRRFVAEWLVHQQPEIRQTLDLGVRFV